MYLARGKPLHDEAGGVIGWVGINLDITEMKRTEASLREATRAKNRLLAAVGHDLKQPLQVIRSTIDSMVKASTDERRQELADRGTHAVNRLDSALNSLVNASRLDLGGVNPVIEHVVISRLLNHLAESFGHEVEAKGLRLKIFSSTMRVETDPDLLLTILGNLVNNAIKYTDRGGILIGCLRRGGCLSVEVVDTGIGISFDQLNLIFEEFKQVSPQRDGFGLGLSIVKRTADILAVPISVYSRLGRGSRFTVEVPLA